MENEYFFSILINIFIPLIVLWYYIRLVYKMKAEMVESPPIFSLFLVMMSYVMISSVNLSPLCVHPSYEYVIIIVCYSYLIAPIILFMIAVVNHGKRYYSRFHSGVYKASLIYILIVPMSVVVWFCLI